MGTVWQTGGIFKSGVFHAEFLGNLSHGLGKIFLGIAKAFGQNGGAVVSGFDNQSQNGVANGYGFAFLESQFGRRTVSRVAGNRKFVFEFYQTFIKSVKGDVQRHQLGERCRITQRVGV